MSTLARSDQLVATGRGAPAWRPTDGEPVAVYGAGNFARAASDAIRRAGGAVKYALDRRGGAAVGLPGVDVYVPGAEPTRRNDREAMTAVVGVFNRDADPDEIERQLRSLGYGRVVGVPELYESFADELGPRFWLGRRAVYASERSRIEAAAKLWVDEPSRALYADLLRYRTTWHSDAAPLPASGVQYFPDDVPRTSGPLRFIDCGAFTGDTLVSIASAGMRVERVFAFEPDLTNFAELARYSSEFACDTGAEVSLWPCAVGERAASLRFRADAGEASHLSADGDRAVSVVAIDEVLPSARVTDLKMDIEGAEPEALRGAERLIRRSRPRLAICVYHRAEHLWEIPLFVRELGIPYDYYLRSHGHFGFDVVMYAVPRTD